MRGNIQPLNGSASSAQGRSPGLSDGRGALHRRQVNGATAGPGGRGNNQGAQQVGQINRNAQGMSYREIALLGGVTILSLSLTVNALEAHKRGDTKEAVRYWLSLLFLFCSTGGAILKGWI